MQLTPELWRRAVILYREFERRGEKLSRKKLAEALHITEALARGVIFALENQSIIKFEPRRFEIARRELILADLHIPYHDPLAVEAALSYGDKFHPDLIVILGDLIDMYDISPFIRKPRGFNLRGELKQTRQFLEDLRARFPTAKIVYLEGNHSLRLERYILKNAEKLYDLLDGFLPQLLHLDSLNIEYMSGPIRIGALWHLHGHEKMRGGNPEYITNVIWKNIHDHFIVGHWHREQQKIFKRIDGTTFWGGAVGHLSDPAKAEYAKVNNWTQGFATVEFDDSGHFRARLHRIENGEIY